MVSQNITIFISSCNTVESINRYPYFTIKLSFVTMTKLLPLFLILIAIENCLSNQFVWFKRGRRGSDSHNRDTNELKSSAMHSFTGLEGMEVSEEKRSDDSMKVKEVKHDVKKAIKVDEDEQEFLNDLQQKLAYNSFSPLFPMYPFLL